MVRVWTGEDWQVYCMQLLHRRYAAQNAHALQLVPDRDRGDLGMEAFSHDGCVYQCYAAEEPLETTSRFEKQRDKLTRDLGKFRTYQTHIAAMLGTVIIKQYVLMVPIHDSRLLINHAQAKTKDVVKWELPFISPRFRITIETDAAYENERRQLHAIPEPLLGNPEIGESAKQQWAAENSDLRDTAQRKISKIVSSSRQVDAIVESLVRKYLQGENQLERLRQIQPDAHRHLLAQKADQEDLLALEYDTHGDPSHAMLSNIARDFATKVVNELPILPESTAQTLSWSAVADWLMRCPLDFEAA